MTSPSPALTPRQQAALLAVARRAIRERVRGVVSAGTLPPDPRLQEPGAAFVTLTLQGALRGCIGFVRPVHPLAETVRQCAVAAATADPRFPPVAAEELPRLHLEISLLSPLRGVEDPGAIQVGLHGLCVSQGGRRGLLLPQVAVERGWDRETFLRQTCRKAGLSPDAWRQGATLEVFTVDHWSDGQPVEAPTEAPSPEG